jgi:hypothetical protein
MAAAPVLAIPGPTTNSLGWGLGGGRVRSSAPVRGLSWANSLDNDSSLVDRCLRGEETAWENLVRTHTRRVYAVCYRFTGSDHEAQDLTQDVFVRVFKTLGSFRSGEGSFSVWLMRLARNLLIDHYRRAKQDRATALMACWRAARPVKFYRPVWRNCPRNCVRL